MRKIMVILVTLLFLYGITTLSFAQTSPVKTAKKAKVKTEVISGKIVSIDTTKNEIVVKDNKAGAERTIVIDPKSAASLKADDEVKIKVNAGSNVAESVKKITKASAPIKKKSGK